MTDYSWLHTEMERVKWKSFFVTRKNVSMNSISGASFSPELLPKDYLDFLFEFGEVSFFRNFSSHGHLLSVIAPKIVDVRGRALIYIGGYWLEGRTYLDSEKSRLLILRAGKLRDVADSFSGWLKARFARCKREYSKADWMQLANVPIPFSQQELQVANAFSEFDFLKVGVDANKNILVQVKNGSSIKLHFLDIGVVVPQKLEGAIRVDIADLSPGETQIYSIPCYKSLVRPDEIELFKLPAPTPEDRLAYGELRRMQKEGAMG